MPDRDTSVAERIWDYITTARVYVPERHVILHGAVVEAINAAIRAGELIATTQHFNERFTTMTDIPAIDLQPSTGTVAERDLESYVGHYVRTESMSRWACGVGREHNQCSPHCCNPEYPYGFQGWVTEDRILDGQRVLITDEGMGSPIDADTVISFPPAHRPMAEPWESET